MSDHAVAQQIAGATAYEELHVPALFQEWVEPVLDAAGVGPGQRVLDVACGTGVLARAARRRVGETGAVTALEPDPGMLAVAKRIQPAIEWRTGTAEALPFPSSSFDAVVSQFGMMFFSDRVAALQEMLRVLAPGGRLAVAVWDSLENAPAFAAEVALVEALAGPEAADALRAPFVLGDADATRALFEEAGVADLTVTTRSATARYPSVGALVGADLRGWLPLMGIHLPEALIERILAEAERALSPFVVEGGVAFESPAHIISGRKA